MIFHLYGLMIGLGAWAALMVAEKSCSKSARKLLDRSWVGIILGGIIGARLYHVIDFWYFYQDNLGEILAIWHGGLGIFGGIIGGLATAWFYTRTKEKFLTILDLLSLGLPLGQAIGRFGNYFNQELYGLPTNLIWGIYIKPENRLWNVAEFERFHPLFLYESLWCLVVFLILKKLNLKVGSGKTTAVYLGLYGLGRFFLEYLRIDSWYIGMINVAQAISAGLVISAIAFLCFSRK